MVPSHKQWSLKRDRQERGVALACENIWDWCSCHRTRDLPGLFLVVSERN